MVLPGGPGDTVQRPLQDPVGGSGRDPGDEDDVGHLVDVDQVDGQTDKLVGGAVLEAGTLPPLVAAIQCQVRGVGLVLLRGVAHATPRPLASLGQGAVDLGLVVSTGGVGGYLGVVTNIKYGWIKSSRAPISKI